MTLALVQDIIVISTHSVPYSGGRRTCLVIAHAISVPMSGLWLLSIGFPLFFSGWLGSVLPTSHVAFFVSHRRS